MNQRRNSESEPSPDKGEFSQAMGRLEKAVAELVTVTTGQLSNRATSVIEETTRRLEMELKLKKATEDDPDAAEEYDRRHKRHRSRHWFRDDFEGRYGQLYIDNQDEKIAGVCAAFARYFGVETWIVRMLALTGLIFMPGIVFPGYWIAYFIIEKRHSNQPAKRRRGFRRQKETSMQPAEPEKRSRNRNVRDGDDSTRVLRHLNTDLTQAELRLRRMESFVTSDKYELHKELNRIEQEGKPA